MSDLGLQIVHWPRRHFGWQRPLPTLGGYTANLRGEPPSGAGEDPDTAICALVERVEFWAEGAPSPALSAHPLASDLRESADNDRLLEALRHESESVEIRSDTTSDGLPPLADDAASPRMFGYWGDGELCVEVCTGAPTPGWARAWVQAVDCDPADWSERGRVWARYDSAEGGSWPLCNRNDDGAVEFWELRER